MEWFITYGWVVLIIAIVLLGLYELGLFNPNTYISTQCDFTSDFSCLNAFLYSNGTLQINIVQSTTSPINVTAIGCNTNGLPTNMTKIVPQQNLAIGAESNYTTKCYSNGLYLNGQIGAVFRGYVIINYTNQDTGFRHLEDGYLVLKIIPGTSGYTTTSSTSTSVTSLSSTSSSASTSKSTTSTPTSGSSTSTSTSKSTTSTSTSKSTTTTSTSKSTTSTSSTGSSTSTTTIALGTGYYITPAFFGITFNPPYNPAPDPLSPWPDSKLGSLGKVNGAAWTDVDPKGTGYQWGTEDNVIAEAKTNGAGTFIYTVAAPPPWSESNTTTCTGNICTGPPKSSAVNAFVSNVAIKYKGKIQYFEIWNEPNGKYTNGTPTFWSGNISQLVSLTTNTSRIIKSIDPSALIIGPATTFYSLAPGMSNVANNWLQEFLDDGGAAGLDGISFHYYASSPDCLTTMVLDCMGTSLLGKVDFIKTVMDDNGAGSKLLIDSEGSYTSSFPTLSDPVLEAVVSRWYILQASAGVNIAIWYAYSNNQGVAYNPWDSNALIALNQTYKWLVGGTIYQCTPDPSIPNNAVWTCYLKTSAGNLDILAWGLNSSESYAPPSGYTNYQEWNGTKGTITGGTITLGVQPTELST